MAIRISATTRCSSVTARKLKGGPSNELINYAIYSNSGRTTNWGNTVGTDTVAGTGNGSAQTLQVYGRVPAQTTQEFIALAKAAPKKYMVASPGVGTPNQVYAIVDALREVVPPEKLGLHFHDTRGTALANTLAALTCGVRIFDTSAGGLGGCPFAPGATGNCATEDLVYMLHGMGIETGIDLAKLRAASRFIAERLGRPHASRAYTALEAADARAVTAS